MAKMAAVVMLTILGATTVLMEGLMVLVEVNWVMLCRRIQIIMPYKIQILAMIIRVDMIITHGIIRVLKVICRVWVWNQANNLRSLRVLVSVSLLVAWIITMMILCLIAIQCENNYIRMHLWIYFVEFTILCMYFDMFVPTTHVFSFLLMFRVIGDMFWTCDT